MYPVSLLFRMPPELDGGEEDMMERRGSGNHTSWVNRREATWAAIAGSAYLAPSRIAMEEARERTLVDAAHARLLASGTKSVHQSCAGGERRKLSATLPGLGRWFRRWFASRVIADSVLPNITAETR
jgi:hypothetical protein